MRLIGDGVVDRDGVGGLAAKLGYTPRHLTRVLTAELGAGPLAVARAQRAQTARILLETTEVPITEVAFAAGFASLRQFNDTVREVFAVTPTELRHRRQPDRSRAGRGARRVRDGERPTVSLRLSFRRPCDVNATLSFLGARAIPGVESYYCDPVDGAPTFARGPIFPTARTRCVFRRVPRGLATYAPSSRSMTSAT